MITSIKYKIIADLINNAQGRGADMISYISNMLSDLSNSEISSDSNDRQRLYDQINATYDVINSRNNFYIREMLDFVLSLQKYISDNYSSVNDYLSDNDIKVLPVFANLSEAVGYSIDASNIDNIS